MGNTSTTCRPRRGGSSRCDGLDGREVVTCRSETREATGDGDRLDITQRSRIRILSSLPAETRPEGFAPGGCHAAREHGLTCQLSALPHGAAARTTVCMFGSLKPSDRSSGLRSFGLSEADHSGSLSGSRPMQQRLVCVEAGQTFSIRRVEVLTPQVSSIHCRLTQGRSVALRGLASQDPTCDTQFAHPFFIRYECESAG
jgi:hypothetical protein